MPVPRLKRQRKGHIKEAARDPEDKFYRFISGPPSSHLLGVSILKPGKEFGWGRVEPLVYARHFTYAFPISSCQKLYERKETNTC